jgi:hypothetical protein
MFEFKHSPSQSRYVSGCGSNRDGRSVDVGEFSPVTNGKGKPYARESLIMLHRVFMKPDKVAEHLFVAPLNGRPPGSTENITGIHPP